MPSRRAPRGQILVLTAASMIVLMAIGAIVVDLGMSWMLHRQEQNAADPGSLAAAKWIRDTPSAGTKMQAMQAEACFYAKENGFFAGDANCAAALAAGNLDVNWPPSGPLAGPYSGNLSYVQVVIRDYHPSFFGALFGFDPAEVTTGAVAALSNGTSNTSSLVALGDTCSGNTSRGDSQVSGGATLTIHPATGVTEPGGYVNVNAPCGTINNPGLCDGTGASSALGITGGGTLVAPHAFVVGGCGTNGSGGGLQCYPPGATGCLDEQAAPLGDPLAQLPEPWPYLSGALAVPSCPGIGTAGATGNPNSPSSTSPCQLTKQVCPLNVSTGKNTCVMSPGVYYAGWDIGSQVVVDMKPGMYVLAGYGIKMNAGATMESITGLDPGGNIIDARVTIFSTDYTAGCQAGKQNFCQGAIQISSSGPLRLKATNGTTCRQVSPAICPWAGLLIWQDATTVRTPGDVTINGQSDLILAGTIYAAASKVTINGSNSSTGCSGTPQYCLAVQIIARQWVIAGGAIIDMPYDPSELYVISSRGLVY